MTKVQISAAASVAAIVSWGSIRRRKSAELVAIGEKVAWMHSLHVCSAIAHTAQAQANLLLNKSSQTVGLTMISVIITSVRKWIADRQAVEALAKLSDDRLVDIGLRRGTLLETVRRGFA